MSFIFKRRSSRQELHFELAKTLWRLENSLSQRVGLIKEARCDFKRLGGGSKVDGGRHVAEVELLLQRGRRVLGKRNHD